MGEEPPVSEFGRGLPGQFSGLPQQELREQKGAWKFGTVGKIWFGVVDNGESRRRTNNRNAFLVHPEEVGTKGERGNNEDCRRERGGFRAGHAEAWVSIVPLKRQRRNATRHLYLRRPCRKTTANMIIHQMLKIILCTKKKPKTNYRTLHKNATP